MVADGDDDDGIAAELGRTVRAVANKRAKLGLVSREVARAHAIEEFTDTALVRELQRGGFRVLPPALQDPLPTCFANEATARCG